MMSYAAILKTGLFLLLLCQALPALAVSIKIATLSPDGSAWMVELRKSAEEIAKRTDNRVKFKFYPGGVMGDDQAVLRKIRFGQLHGAALTNGSLADLYPDVQVYNLVLKFSSLQEVDYVRERLDPLIMQGLEESGLATFGLSEIGFAYIMSTSPVRTLTDLRSQKAWVPEGNEVALETIKAFEVSPIPLEPRDVLVSLQTGMIDTVAGSPVGALALQWHTQIKYLTDLPLSYIYGALFVDKKIFNTLSDNDQKIVREQMGKVTATLNLQNRKDNLAAMEALKNQGIEIVNPKKDTVDQLRNLVVSANERLIAEGNLSRDIVNALDRYLQEYRSRNTAGLQ